MVANSFLPLGRPNSLIGQQEIELSEPVDRLGGMGIYLNKS
jgi:hypothetical protein